MLIGYSSSPGKPRCLIHEFLSNGTLEEALEIGVKKIGMSLSKTERSYLITGIISPV